MTRKLMALCLLLAMIPLTAAGLGRGDQGESVSALQNRLLVLGFLEDGVDGQYGAKTAQAVRRARAYLLSQGIDGGDPDDGDAGDALFDLLDSATFPRKPDVLREGDTGLAVSRLQTRLISLGYLSGGVDGGLGANTARALAVFQYFSGLPITSQADMATQALLYSIHAQDAPFSSLCSGMSGDSVLRLQQRLTVTGFLAIDGNGHYGAATVAAVKSLQAYIKRSGRFDSSLDATLLSIDFQGIADPLVQSLLFSESFPLIPAPLSPNQEGIEVRRLQTRLKYLGYLQDEPDGGYGSRTSAAVAAFQRRNGLKESGKGDKNTMNLLFSEAARRAPLPYQITISLSEQTATVHALSEQGDYSIHVSSFSCATGKPATPTTPGRYEHDTGPGPEWYAYNKGTYYVRYPFEISGKIRIHSIPYDRPDGEADKTWIARLGAPLTGGSIMVSEENARWIWERCPAHTPVIITP